MTTYATRSPLQPLHNPHMMSELRRSSRRISANAGLKEDVPKVNGVGHESGRDRKHGVGVNSRSKTVSGGLKTVEERNKRKFGKWSFWVMYYGHLCCLTSEYFHCSSGIMMLPS